MRKRLESIVDHWRGKAIYDDDTVAAMVAAMLTAKPSATIPEPGEKASSGVLVACQLSFNIVANLVL